MIKNNNKINIFFASDHAGFEMKTKLIDYVKNKLGFNVKDFGAFEFNKNDDYPDFISLVAKEISKNPKTIKGIILGGSGQGEAIVANKFKNIRAIVLYDYNEKIIKLSRQHNNANVLSLGARFLSLNNVKKAVKLWLETEFSNEKRHLRRIKKIKPDF
jgi:ribose 5-phosphate isomerase B